MIVDKKGNMFEDRRKNTNGRRQDDSENKGAKKGNDRRKAPEQVSKKR